MTSRDSPAALDVLTCPLAGTTLVEASAGTGKTWAICALYVRLLLERQLEVQQILVVTFTNAATAELRTRIRERVAEALRYARDGVADDASVRALVEGAAARCGIDRAHAARILEAAMNGLDEAAILTIHGFANRALADTPFAAGMPLALELVTDDSAIRDDVVNDFWRRNVASSACGHELAAHMVDRGDSPEALARILARRLAKPLAELRFPAGSDDARPDRQPLDDAFATVRALWNAERDAIEAVLHDLPPRTLNGNSHSPKAIDRALDDWDAWLRSSDPLLRLPKESKLDLLTTRRLVKGTNRNGTTPVHPFFAVAQVLLDAKRTLDASLAKARLALIHRLVDEAPEEIRRRKREGRIAGYDDLLYNLHRALVGDALPGFRERLRAQYRAALIDEFQDTDPLQLAIFDAVYTGSGLPVFMVGDPKQSIYGFRNADLYAYFGAAQGADEHYTLLANQRATPELIAAQNALFGANPNAFGLPELGYRDASVGTRERARLVDESEPRAALTVWRLPPGEAAAMARATAKKASVHATAAEIARLLRAASEGRVRLDGRPLRPGDIAVLVRTHAQGVDVKEALAALHVGSVELAQESIFRTPDADELARILTAVLDPARADLVRSALATQILGLDAGAIAALSDDEVAFSARTDRFVEYRHAWLARGFGVMFRQLIAGEDVAARLLVRDDGERRMTNLLHLGELLHDAAATGLPPDALLRWLAAQRDERARDDARELRLDSDRDLVHVVTVHKAKGLEYPIVFCPFFFEGGYWRPPSEVREYHAGGRAILDFALKDDATSAAIDEAIEIETSAERLRLLYVALTRASHRVYLTAGIYTQQSSLKDSVRALGNWLAAGRGTDFGTWLTAELKSADVGQRVTRIDVGWRDVAARGAPNVALVPLPTSDSVPLPAAAADPASIVARTPPKTIASGFRIGSFSSLAQGATRDDAAADHDARVVEADVDLRAPEPVEIADDDIVRFPRGAAAGDCLHAALERVDFTATEEWPAIAAAAIAAFPPGGRAADHGRLATMIVRMLADVTATTLPFGAALGSVPRAHRLAELKFTFPARDLDAAALRDAVVAAGYPMPRLTPGRLNGYLSGYIDLVFEHAGRHYVLDWKSNYLGEAAADFGADAVARTMRDHGYHLQQLIYAVALERYLRRRLRDYDHATHFGGVLYLFVRGVRPRWTEAGGAPAGVYFDRPTAATLARVAAALGAIAKEA